MYNEKINDNISNAMKAHNDVELKVWRAIKTAFMNYTTAKAGNILNDEVEFNIINKLAAQRKDSIEQYTNANRLDLAEAEKAELEVLMSLLPKEPTEDEIIAEINNIVSTLDHKVTMADMKVVMQGVKVKYPTVNGGIVSKYLRTLM